jgi:hypothetical protein
VEQPRTLPLRVELGDGEAADSWLLRLAHRNGVSLLGLARVLGFGDRLRVWRNYALTWKLPAGLLRRIEAQAGLAAGALDAAMLDQFDALGWKPIPGSRFCSACLNETGGRWPIRWQLPHAFACLAHQCLLAVLCPACRRTPRFRLTERSGLAAPNRCTLGTTRHGKSCDGDMLTHRPQHLSASDPRLAAQAWIDARLDRMDADGVTDLRDVNALAAWFLHRIDPAELARFGAATVTAMHGYRDGHQALKRHQPTAALLAAAMTCQAVAVITADDRERPGRLTPLLRDVHTSYRTGQAPSMRGPMILSHKRLTSLSQPLQRKVLLAIDAHLPVTERLRYRTRTATPRAPEPDSPATDRARHIPQYLWPDWIIRFLPLRGAYVDEVAVDISNALLIPGNPVRNIHATAELTRWRNYTSIFLSETAQRHPDILTAICALAAHLDRHGSPIDYRRRRATFTDITLTPPQWHDLCYQANTDPGRNGRLLHVRRYLFCLLTGADLSNRQHRLAFGSSHEKGNYRTTLHRHLNTPLQQALHRHAAGLLQAAGIDEPVTWSPPADCVADLDLPGRDPDDIDLTTVDHLLHVERLNRTAVARRLGVSVEHIRYAQHQLHRPPAALASNSPILARQIRERAAALLTAEFFQREHVDGGTNLLALATQTGLPYTLLTQHARSHGIRVSNLSKRAATANAERHDGTDPGHQDGRKSRAATGRHRTLIDAEWLREQAGTLQRTNGDIGAELGLSHETIRRHRKHLGIPARPSGSAGHTVHTRTHPDLPADIRRAVEGKRHGWQRLRRFQQLAAHSSVNSAAHALNLHTSNLLLQLDRLEADIGAALIHRTDHRYQSMALTRRGRRLLNQLNQPAAQQQLDRHAHSDRTLS